MRGSIIRVLFAALWLTGPVLAAEVPTPSQIYGELFERVQLEGVYPDSKTFVDALPMQPPEVILEEYRRARERPGFDLAAFVKAHFEPTAAHIPPYHTIAGQDVRDHIDRLWSVLERKPDDQRPYSSRLALPHRYIVPGGRFNEIYYWDSYFTMLGLETSGRHDLNLDMVANFAYLIDTYGHIPNGNRSYYLSRSQPPFFAAMIELIAEREGQSAYKKYLPQLKREYAFWMEGSESLAPGTAHRRVVRLSDGSLLNRYWDDRDTPREESYKEDVATARSSGRPAAEVYRNLRAAAESGWDFSSRWFEDGKTLATIRTVELIPPDLNSLLYQLEQTIAKACRIVEDEACASDMGARAKARKAAVSKFLWDPELGAFTDYEWRTDKRVPRVTAATLYPLYFKLSNESQARMVATAVRAKLLRPHGLSTSTVNTGEQWDEPNGWAPLQWIAIGGLRHYGQESLAGVIAQRWVAKNLEVFHATGKLVEKYDVTGAAEGGGGEYPLQDGFGWTNGVLRRLLALYPNLAPRKPASKSRKERAHGLAALSILSPAS
ncbi:MAG TPA: alpha,alpha-trehalase TreF [Steroidobacteraceae bacterium]